MVRVPFPFLVSVPLPAREPAINVVRPPLTVSELFTVTGPVKTRFPLLADQNCDAPTSIGSVMFWEREFRSLIPPLRMVNSKPPMENDGEPAVNVMELTSKAAFTLGESFKPLPKTKLAVPLLAGAALVSQFSPLVKLESAPPESQVSANAGIETAPT